MKVILTFLLVTITGQFVAQDKPSFIFHSSELYGTYDFLMKISENFPDNELKTIFISSPFHTEEYTKEISDFAQLRIDYSYSFNQYPATLKAGMMSRDIIERNLSLSENTAQFRDRSIGIIPTEELSKMTGILEHFLPVYRKLVLTPYKKEYQEQKKQLLHYVSDGHFSRYFQTGLNFYGTKWNPDMPIDLNLLLSLDKGNLGARAFANVAVCEASVDLKDHLTFFIVALHEICHMIYDNQPLQMKQDIRTWFDETKSPNSQYALLLMNEVLATAVTNGYITEKEKGALDNDDWYDNPYISKMAKAIYPVIQEYVKENKPMDKAFVNLYVKTYDEQFPQWGKELVHLLTYRYIVADDAADWTYIRRKYRYYSYNRLGAPFSDADIEKASSAPVTKLFIVSRDNKMRLSQLRKYFPEIAARKLNYKQEFISVFTLQDNTKLFIINRKKSTVEQLMTQYFPSGVIQ